VLEFEDLVPADLIKMVNFDLCFRGQYSGFSFGLPEIDGY